MCVLATVLDAIDLGLRVVMPIDAVCSSSDTMQDSLLTLYASRFSWQVEIAETSEILTAWDH